MDAEVIRVQQAVVVRLDNQYVVQRGRPRREEGDLIIGMDDISDDRGGRRPPARVGPMSISRFWIVRRSVFRCMPSFLAALH